MVMTSRPGFDMEPGDFKPAPLSENAVVVMERRITKRDDRGESIETPDECFRRVAQNLAEAELRFGGSDGDRAAAEESFYRLMASLDFLPNSPTLVNAGRELQQLSACFVLPVPDSIDGIFEAIKHTAIIHKSGGGTGFAFSRLRPAHDRVQSTMGVASGPVSFMKVFDAATEAIKQGGTRRGANMGILRVDHPDIDDFIAMKADMTTLQNFNISVAVTDPFMAAVKAGTDYDIVNPKSGEVAGHRSARDVWETMFANAWKNGDPGVVFIDRINAGRANPVPKRGPVESTNPCVTGDTLVYTSRGLLPAAELAADGAPTTVVVGDGQRRQASSVFRTGRKPVFRLATEEGYELRLTADHRVMTERGWVPAGDLVPGDRLQLLRGRGGFGVGGSLALGRLLGWLVGDGTFAGDRAVLSFFGAEKQELAPLFAEAMAEVVPPGAGKRRDYPIGVGEIEGRDEARVRSARFMRIAVEHGLAPGNKHHVPEGVFTGSEEMQRGFLQALFTADGHVGGGREKGLSVRLTSVSERLLKDVQRLLINFGIVSHIYADRRPAQVRSLPDGHGGRADYETQAYHDLVVAKDNLHRFASDIGFLASSKQSALVERLATYRRGPYRESFFARFAALIPDGDEDVYDLTEPDTHSFVANGLVVHNCGEQPLYPYDSCNLGSINLGKFTTGAPGAKEVDYERLGRIVRRTVHLLDNVIEMNAYPIPEIAETSHAIRRIGLGVMGWSDLLIELRVPYNSERALDVARDVMRFIQDEADAASQQLAMVRGNFPDWADSMYGPRGSQGPRPMRNSTRTTIAPTGTLSIIADCSGGIEPVFALAFIRSHYLDKDDPTKRTELTEVNEQFAHVARAEGFYSDELMRFLAEGGHLADRDEVPQWVKDVFVTAHDIAPEWHVRMQAAFQEFTDNAVSKTINFPNSATVDDVRVAYELAYETGCKGITIYRDGSRELQVLKYAEKEPEKSEAEKAIEAAQALVLQRPSGPIRRKLPDERAAITHKFRVGEQEGYMTVGLFDDGTPGEVFINVNKQGSTVSGLMDTVAMLTSYALQYGVPIAELASKLKNTRFEPSGPTSNRQIPIATSIVDYVFRWLEFKFSGVTASVQPTLIPVEEVAPSTAVADPKLKLSDQAVASGVGCPDCGAVLYYAEGCLICRNCFYNQCG